MATTTNRSKRVTKNADAAHEITKTESVNPEISESSEKKSYRIKKDLNPNMIVTVKNGFNGTLVYRSNKTGEIFRWNEFGDEQDLELIELKSAKNSYKSFFINNWFLFDDPEIMEWLGVTLYYKNALKSTESFDKLFKKSPDEIAKTIAGLSDGQKKSVAFRAKNLISEGKIDSIKVINTLENSLSVQLIER